MKDRNSRNSTSTPDEEPRKRPLGYRVGHSLRAAGEFGRDAVTKPGTLPNTAHGFLRRKFRKLWNARGGGLYAFGYAVTFIWLEAKTITGDFVSSDTLGDFVTGEVIEYLMRFATDTIVNMVRAFIWPLFVIEWHPPWGIVALAVAFLAFPRFVKQPLERWLSDDAPSEPRT